MILKGKIKDGLGNASIWVKKINNIFLEKENIKLFPGTLNIKLEKDYNLKTDWEIAPEEYGGTQNVLVQKCALFGEKCYIVRAERTAHKNDIIEIVSDVNFRKKYNLKNEDEVIINL